MPFVSIGQQTDNSVTIELGPSTFSTDRPYTISVLIRENENRPTITFPDIVGLTKRGTSTSITTSESGGQTLVSQIITQTYTAPQPGTFRVLPFTIAVNGVTARSEGAVLLVRPGTNTPMSGTAVTNTIQLPTESGAAFLSLRTNKPSVYVGEGFGLRLSLFVSDNYPFELRFDGVDAQLQSVLKQIRPTNTWEEDAGIRELKGLPVVVNGRKFSEYVIFQGTFFPLSAQPIRIPAVSLNLLRVRQAGRTPETVAPVGTPAAPGSTSATEPADAPNKPATTTRGAPKSNSETIERIPFLTRPLAVDVRALPPHPLRGQVAVGTYRLIERIDRAVVGTGKSARYAIRIEGEGNIAAVQAPLKSLWQAGVVGNAATPSTDVAIDAFPEGTSQEINRTGDRVSGNKTFRYFLVPKQEGKFSLNRLFGFIYFNPRTARYDTLQSAISLKVGGGGAANVVAISENPTATAADALYAGLNQMDSSKQPLNWIVLTRAVANVLLVLMILGMIFVFLRK